MALVCRILVVSLMGAGLLILPVVGLLGMSNERDGFKLFLGKNQDELVELGRSTYPNESVAGNRQCHRLAARMTTDKYGPLVTLAGGVANEVIEALATASYGQNPLSAANRAEIMGDLGANWRGMKDSIRDTLTGTPLL